MKKIKTTFIITLAHLLICTSLMAQAPQGFEYQAVVRNASGNILVSQSVGLQITLKQGSPSGTNVYQETFSATTNLYGLVNLQIGSGTTIDDFTTIDWATGPYFIEVALDVTGGTSYSVMGTSQLLSVPYALHAKTVEVDNVDDADNDPSNELQNLSISNDILSISNGNSVVLPNNGGKTYLLLTGNITDSEAATKIAEDFGSNTQFVMIQNTTNLTTVDLSGIIELIDLTIIGNTNLTSVLTPNLTTILGSVYIYNNAVLTNVNFSLMEKVFNNFIVSSNATLTSLLIPALTTIVNFNASSNALPTTEINAILAQLVAINPILTTSTIQLNYQNPLAPPTGQGITDKNTLISNGNMVATD